MLQQVKLPPFQNVVANGIATLTLPVGPTIEAIYLVLGGTFTKAMITNLVIKVNGKIVWQITGTRQDNINTWKGFPAVATILPIFFTELKARDRLGQLLGAYATALGYQMTIEVTIAGATSPTLEAHILSSGPRAANDRLAATVCKLVHFPTSFSAGGRQAMSMMTGQGGALLLKRLYFFHANMTALEVRQNGIVIAEPTLALNQHQHTENGKVTVAGLYVHDFVIDNNVDEAISPVSLQRLELFPTLSAADTINLYAELIDPVGNV